MTRKLAGLTAAGAIALMGSLSLKAQTWVGTTGDWNTASNWNPATVPYIGDTAIFKTSPNTIVSFSSTSEAATLKFNAAAPAYTFQLENARGFTLDGDGIVNNSAFAPIFVVTGGSGLSFINSAKAANLQVNANAGATFFQGNSNAAQAVITATNGSSTEFLDSASAGHVTVSNDASGVFFAGTANGAQANITNQNNGYTAFTATSDAGHATVTNTSTGGITYFEDSATAGNSTINNNAGSTQFLNSSKAGHSTITNDDGSTIFAGTSTAESATITNKNAGTTVFDGGTTAAHATILNTSKGETGFDNGSAGSATITNSHKGTVQFGGTGTAAQSTILNKNKGAAYFFGDSKAASSTITNKTGGTTHFEDNSSASQSTITNKTGGVTYFDVSSTAGQATIDNKGGSTVFGDHSKAKTATITNSTAGSTLFTNHANADEAIIINKVGGATSFIKNASGGTAKVVNQAGGQLDISGLTNGGTTLGTVQGAGNVYLGGNNLELLGRSDTPNAHISGAISDGGIDGGTGGSLTIDSNGSVTLSGANTYTGGTGLLNGVLKIGSASALGTGDVFVSGGVLRVAGNNGPTAINVGGNYDQTVGGTLRLAAYDGGTNDNDVLVVAGNSVALSNNSILKLADPNGPIVVTAGTSYDLIHNDAGGITGMFGTVTGLNNFTLDPGTFATLVYTSNDVTLAFRQFLATIPGLTPNQTTIANVLDRLEGLNTSGQFGTVVNGLYNQNASGLGGALDQLSPEQFAKFTSVTAFNNASFETQAMDNYLNGQRGGANGIFIGGNGTLDSSGLVINDPSYDPSLAMVHSRLLAWNAAPYANGLLSDSSEPLFGGVEMTDRKDMKQMAPVYDNPWNFFVRGNVILAQGFSQQDVGHFDDNTESVVLGTDYRITPNFLVGLTAGYAHTDVTLDNNGSSATVDSYSPGIYAAFANKGWYANFNGSYTHNAYTESRSIAFLGQTANGAPEGNEGVVNLDGGYEFHKGAFTFGPLAGLQYTHLTVDGYNESGSDANLGVNEDQSDSLRSRLGGRVSFNMVEGSVNINPHLDASWQHEFMDQSRGITSQFNNFGGGSFAVRTNSPSRDSALVDAGVNVDVCKTVTVFTDYMVQAGQDNYFGQSVQAGVKIGF